MSPFKSFLEKFRRKEEPSICPHLIWGQISLHTYRPKCGGLDVSRPLSKNEVSKYCMSEPHKRPIYPQQELFHGQPTRPTSFKMRTRLLNLNDGLEAEFEACEISGSNSEDRTRACTHTMLIGEESPKPPFLLFQKSVGCALCLDNSKD